MFHTHAGALRAHHCFGDRSNGSIPDSSSTVRLVAIAAHNLPQLISTAETGPALWAVLVLVG
jgi:hypothetical protein